VRGFKIIVANRTLNSTGVFFATCFGVGYLPKAPGTWASLIALPVAWAISNLFGILVFLIIIGILFCIGIWAANRCIKYFGHKDPSYVVVEVGVGQFFTLVFIPPDLIFYTIGFILFRIFDILKPWPINWADRDLNSGFGIMFDDVLAGVYSSIILVIYVNWA